MAYKGLRQFIRTLESAGELVTITERVSPKLEITEITDRISKNGGPALLFTNTGTKFPLLINSMGSERRMSLALGVSSLDQIRAEIGGLVRLFLSPKGTLSEKVKLLPELRRVSSWMPVHVRGKGSCQQVIMDPPDLTQLPVLTCWPADGGPFITLPCVHTQDPETGIRNVGMYRMQVFGPTYTGMHWHLHKDSAGHYRKYKRSGQRMPVAVTLGGDPAYIYAATAPLPEGLDEYLLAGFLRKKRVRLVTCLTNDLQVPEDVDFVIEGYVDPAETKIPEGPFGDHTGFYSLKDYYPVFHVTCITRRKDAVYPATIVGIPPQEDGWIGKATEKIFLEPIRMSVAPEVTDLHMPVEGVFHNLVLASIRSRYPGQAVKVMNALWGAGQMMFNKILVVADEQVKADDYEGFLQQVCTHVDPIRDIHFIRGPVDILDHASSEFAYGSKLGIDATQKTGVQPGDPGFRLSYPSETLLLEYPEITSVNDALVRKGFPILILGIKKSVTGHIRRLAGEMVQKELTGGMKFILFTDPAVALMDLSSITWVAANNLDPIRDCFHPEIPGAHFPLLFLDATRKDPKLDDFSREWPNIILMDDQTIAAVDAKWDKLGLGPLLTSPSIRYKSLKITEGAVVK